MSPGASMRPLEGRAGTFLVIPGAFAASQAIGGTKAMNKNGMRILILLSLALGFFLGRKTVLTKFITDK